MALQEELEKRGNWLFRYRGILPFSILIAGMFLYLWRRLHPGAFLLGELPEEAYYGYACLFISLLGLFVRVYTVGHTPKLTSGRNVKEQVASVLNTTGSYSVVRHPLYVGNFFMWLGLSLFTGSVGFVLVFCLAFWIYYERIMFAEEQFLRRKFGAQYLEWAEGVPPFVPKFRQFCKPEVSFSWRKVLKKEKNGFAALFMVFFIFNAAGEIVVRGRDFNYIFLAGFLLGVVNYILVKLLGSHTGLLEERDR
jgi:protein-S-isoprenylcysteine O-methyltransferase Ste14